MKYIPQLLNIAGLTKETLEFEQNFCEMWYRSHQIVRLGCGRCSEKSEFINTFSPEATKKHEDYFKN